MTYTSCLLQRSTVTGCWLLYMRLELRIGRQPNQVKSQNLYGYIVISLLSRYFLRTCQYPYTPLLAETVENCCGGRGLLLENSVVVLFQICQVVRRKSVSTPLHDFLSNPALRRYQVLAMSRSSPVARPMISYCHLIEGRGRGVSSNESRRELFSYWLRITFVRTCSKTQFIKLSCRLCFVLYRSLCSKPHAHTLVITRAADSSRLCPAWSNLDSHAASKFHRTPGSEAYVTQTHSFL